MATVFAECCPIMRNVVSTECDKHRLLDCPDAVIFKCEDGRYVMPVKDGGASWYEVQFCPWCGVDLKAQAS